MGSSIVKWIKWIKKSSNIKTRAIVNCDIILQNYIHWILNACDQRLGKLVSHVHEQCSFASNN